MLRPEPATHKTAIRTLTTEKYTLVMYEIGIRYHYNRYTPETAYFVSVNGKGKQYTGKNCYTRALADYEATAEQIDPQYWQKETVTPVTRNP